MFTCVRRNSSTAFEKIMTALSLGNNKQSKLAETDVKKFDSPFPINFVAPQLREAKVTTLSNGVRVLSETPSVPGLVTVGVLLEVGSQNETKETSGALLSIKATQYKTNLNTNETINYNMVQMTGGQYSMDYDRERSIFKAQCLSHDVPDIVGMLSDCVLEPRSSVTVNAAISKMKHLHKLYEAKNPGQKSTELAMSQIYGHQGLGMPLLGFEKNIDSLNAYTLQKFQIENFSPERIIVGGLGVENHAEFVSLVESHFRNIKYGTGLRPIAKQELREGEIRIADSSTHKNEALLLFESVGADSKDFVLAALAREYFGQADVSNPNCHASNNGVFVTDLYSREKSLYAAEAFNFNFKETGVFGLRLTSSGDGANKSIEALSNHLKTLDRLTESDLLQAKKRLKRRIIEGTENDFQRINELLSHQSVFGEDRLKPMTDQIDKVSAKDFIAFLRRTVSGKAAAVIQGPNAGAVHSLNKIKELLK